MRDMGTDMFIFPNTSITHWGYKGFEGNYHNFLKEQTNDIDTPMDAPLTAPGLDIRFPNQEKVH